MSEPEPTIIGECASCHFVFNLYDDLCCPTCRCTQLTRVSKIDNGLEFDYHGNSNEEMFAVFDLDSKFYRPPQLYNRKCARCDTTYKCNVMRANDTRVLYAFCDKCLSEYTALEGWNTVCPKCGFVYDFRNGEDCLACAAIRYQGANELEWTEHLLTLNR